MSVIKRRWYAHRQAYEPRWWLMTLFVMPVGGGVGALTGHLFGLYGLLVTIPVSVLLGWSSSKFVWDRWARRNPALGPREMISVQQRAGRWN